MSQPPNTIKRIKLSKLRLTMYHKHGIQKGNESPGIQETIDALAESIKLVGLMQPLIVYKSGSVYQVVAGGLRVKAIRKLGKSYKHSTVSCQVIPKTTTKFPAVIYTLSESMPRAELSCLAQIKNMRTIRTAGHSMKEVADILGTSLRRVQQLFNIESLLTWLDEQFGRSLRGLRYINRLRYRLDLVPSEHDSISLAHVRLLLPYMHRQLLTDKEWLAVLVWIDAVDVLTYEKMKAFMELMHPLPKGT